MASAIETVNQAKFDLEWLRTSAEQAAKRFNVPGVQVAVVRGGEVLFAGGFGLRDVAAGLPITEHTVFAHGSTGKSVTALVMASLVDDGLLNWDTKVRDLLPDFRLADTYVTEKLSVRDVLSHRWGMARHEFAHLAQPGVDRGELVRRLRYLELSKELRELFQYCNFGYLLAGHIIGTVTGSTYEEQLRKRLLEPLGMPDTRVGTEGLEGVADRAVAYDEKDGEPVPIAYRQMDNMTPAGGLLSSATDAARYLLCQLGGGELDGKRIVSEAVLTETKRPQMVLGGPELGLLEQAPGRVSAYGMGWMLGTFHGRRYVSHGGGIDGFTTEFALLPDEGIGVAVCGNRATGLPNALSWQLLERLLGEEGKDWGEFLEEQTEKARAALREQQAVKTVEGKAPAHALAEYAGRYEHPGYGVLDVTANEGKLATSLGATGFTTEHRHFETWNLTFEALGPIKFELDFVTDGSGDVVAAEVNFEPSVGAIRFQKEADAAASDKDRLRTFAGTYVLGPITVEVKVEAGPKLVVFQNGVRVELAPAPGRNKYTVPQQPGLTLEFVLDESGKAVAIATPQGSLNRAD